MIPRALTGRDGPRFDLRSMAIGPVHPLRLPIDFTLARCGGLVSDPRHALAELEIGIAGQGCYALTGLSARNLRDVGRFLAGYADILDQSS